MKSTISVAQAKRRINDKLSHFFGVTPADATNEQYYKAVAMILREMLSEKNSQFRHQAEGQDSKQIYYLCMEFLMGRSLKNNLYNLGLTETFEKALAGFDVKLEQLYDEEPDAGLGNGGLGRLAACYLDGLASDGYQSMGYSIRYEAGIFKQKLVDGWQTELPDFWLPGGEVWLVPREERAQTVSFEGWVDESWDGEYHTVTMRDCNTVIAVPYDMYVSGLGDGVARLRLWAARKPALDMSLFNQGEYIKAMEQSAMAETISKVLYPADNTPEGKSLRLRQQYFLVSASVQDIIHRHLSKYGTLDNLPEKVAIHINDTHPTLAIPELMRIMLDECGYDWDSAWKLVTDTMAYTNHTIMAEALEKWPEDMVKSLLPRIYQILVEMNKRLCARLWNFFPGEAERVGRMAIIAYGYIHMANLCVAMTFSTNGVSKLHGDILKQETFHDFYLVMPEKFSAITNGITHRRWLMACNPELTKLICDTIGTDWVKDPELLHDLAPYADDAAFREQFEKIKHNNKVRLSNFLKEHQGAIVDPDFIFDAQSKRLHEYKRQMLNALHILVLYNRIVNDPNFTMHPRVFIFGSKAAPGYNRAKQIIRFINGLSALIAKHPRASKMLQVVFLENYDVSSAQMLIPATEISEQISTASKEASGTGNMKYMMNGAITIGTMDGANVEISEQVGMDNIYIFGMRSDTVLDMYRERNYNPMTIFETNQELRLALTQMIDGTVLPDAPSALQDLYHSLLIGDWGNMADPFFVLKDFGSYSMAQRRIDADYADRDKWNRMAVINTAMSGVFCSDRTIREYNDTIWHLDPLKRKV